MDLSRQLESFPNVSVLERLHFLSVSKTSDVANDKVKKLIDKLGQFVFLVHLKTQPYVPLLGLKTKDYVCTCMYM